MTDITNKLLIEALRWANDVYQRADASHWPRKQQFRSCLDEGRSDLVCPADPMIATAFHLTVAVYRVTPERCSRVLSMLAEMRDGEHVHNQRSVAKELGVTQPTVGTWARQGLAQLRANAELMAALDLLFKSPHPETTSRNAHAAVG